MFLFVCVSVGLQNEVVVVSLVASGEQPSPHLRDEGRLNVRTHKHKYISFIILSRFVRLFVCLFVRLAGASH